MSLRSLVTRVCANCANNDLKGTDSDDRADCVRCEANDRSEWEPHPLLVEGFQAGQTEGRCDVFDEIARMK